MDFKDECPRVDFLDHGFVRLIDHMGNDLSVVRNARQSYDAAWRAGTDEGSDHKLINYLWRNKHTTPFESVEFQFEIHVPMFIGEQILRHRTWSFNKISGRYSVLPNEFYVPHISVIGKQATSNKQGRDIDVDTMWASIVRETMDRAYKHAYEDYKLLLNMGVARELARVILPAGIYTNMFAKVDLLNLLKFIRLREDPHAQYEINKVARAMKKLITPIVPVCMQAFEGESK